ncbi:unnamed protein product [Sphenostylis stenocarpa]|uniref:NAD-dependent epimerase/dehydratase domain-containing protein n=1 Tax=Sphenostylis stenocarpa TaxID=92480 RepID=A0AA86S5S7_9FABA|nr:unnamed protein product [Sphenostylis stenocarpa]
MNKVKVLVVGGTGYLGQHLLQAYDHAIPNANGTPFAFDVAFTHHSSSPPHPLLDAIPSSLPIQVDLKTGVGFEAISSTFGQPDVVVNCAAISVPRACEIDPVNAHAINVPSSIVQWLQSFEEKTTLLIHLSTDQEGKQMQLLLNVGGADRVSRVQMAEAVAQFRGLIEDALTLVNCLPIANGVFVYSLSHFSMKMKGKTENIVSGLVCAEAVSGINEV